MARSKRLLRVDSHIHIVPCEIAQFEDALLGQIHRQDEGPIIDSCSGRVLVTDQLLRGKAMLTTIRKSPRGLRREWGSLVRGGGHEAVR
jgi:hypothetical protein